MILGIATLYNLHAGVSNNVFLSPIIRMMCMTLGGRASEELFFGNVSTGASDELIVPGIWSFYHKK